MTERGADIADGAIQRLDGGTLAMLLLESMPAAMVVAAPNGALLGVNGAAHDLLEVDRPPRTISELRALVELHDFETGEPVTSETSVLTRALAGEASGRRQTLRALRSDTTRIIDAAAKPVYDADGKLVAAVLTFTDVTPIVEGERQREEFLSIVSHELKTPLTPMKAISQLIRSRIRRARAAGMEPDLDALEKNLEIIERQVDRMNALVNDLLDVSRAGRGTFDLNCASFDLATVVRDVVQRYIDATEDDGRHRFSFEAPETLPIVADQARIEQLLWNVIGNAVKYSPRGGSVSVALERQEGSAVIAVTDQGIGIDAGDLSRLGSSPFQRGVGKAATFSGMGIGLYLSRLVADGHGGTLVIASDGEDRGATVTARLPLDGAAHGS